MPKTDAFRVCCVAILILIHSSVVFQFAHAQDWPYLHTVDVTTTVTFDEATQTFFYSYRISNPQSNPGKLSWFEIDISRSVQSVTYDTLGLRFSGAYVEGDFRRNYPKVSAQIVPVGFPSLPRYWIGGVSIRFTATIFGQFINPGDTISGIIMNSKGLPGIRSFHAEPQEISDFFPSVEDVEDPDSLVAVVDSAREAVKFHGLTIGPTAPPANFVPLVFLDTLISYKHQAFDLGWIKNPGIVQSLDAKLENAQAQLQRNNTTAAKNILQAFVNEVEALWKQEQPPYGGEQMTSEAYALLKFNAEYLISKL